MPYDLVIKGGHVLDPGQGLDGRLDIGITDGKIVAIQPEIPSSEAKRVVQIKGDSRYVLPGLIDLHTHVVPPRWDDFAARFGGGKWPRLVPEADCRGTLMTGDQFFRAVDDR